MGRRETAGRGGWAGILSGWSSQSSMCSVRPEAFGLGSDQQRRATRKTPRGLGGWGPGGRPWAVAGNSNAC